MSFCPSPDIQIRRRERRGARAGCANTQACTGVAEDCKESRATADRGDSGHSGTAGGRHSLNCPETTVARAAPPSDRHPCCTPPAPMSGPAARLAFPWRKAPHFPREGLEALLCSNTVSHPSDLEDSGRWLDGSCSLGPWNQEDTPTAGETNLRHCWSLVSPVSPSWHSPPLPLLLSFFRDSLSLRKFSSQTCWGWKCTSPGPSSATPFESSLDHGGL